MAHYKIPSQILLTLYWTNSYLLVNWAGPQYKHTWYCEGVCWWSGPVSRQPPCSQARWEGLGAPPPARPPKDSAPGPRTASGPALWLGPPPLHSSHPSPPSCTVPLSSHCTTEPDRERGIANDYTVKPLNKVYTHWKCPLFSISPLFRGNNNYTDYLMY